VPLQVIRSLSSLPPKKSQLASHTQSILTFPQATKVIRSVSDPHIPIGGEGGFYPSLSVQKKIAVCRFWEISILDKNHIENDFKSL